MRPGVLLDRCVPSVLKQHYRPLEHVIVSDGPDPGLARAARELDGRDGVAVRFFQLPDHHPGYRWGHRARLTGADLAAGDYLFWLDDDNAYRPDHVEKLAAMLDADPGLSFAWGTCLFHRSDGAAYQVGAPEPVLGGLDTSALAHRREALQAATWRDEGQATVDWDLVERWLAAGLRGAHCPDVTVDYYMPGAPPGVRVEKVEAPLTMWTLHAAGPDISAEHEDELHDRVAEVLADPKFKTHSSQLSSVRHNGPVHDAPPKAARATKGTSGA